MAIIQEWQPTNDGGNNQLDLAQTMKGFSRHCHQVNSENGMQP
jgi:hypothetical protein